jgi:hypothetical protein
MIALFKDGPWRMFHANLTIMLGAHQWLQEITLCPGVPKLC